jgi:hypothetical protein
MFRNSYLVCSYVLKHYVMWRLRYVALRYVATSNVVKTLKKVLQCPLMMVSFKNGYSLPFDWYHAFWPMSVLISDETVYFNKKIYINRFPRFLLLTNRSIICIKLENFNYLTVQYSPILLHIQYKVFIFQFEQTCFCTEDLCNKNFETAGTNSIINSVYRIMHAFLHGANN